MWKTYLRYILKSKLRYDRRSVGQSWRQACSWGEDQIFITVRQLWVCWCGTPSLTRGRVCRLQLLLALASAVILGSFTVSGSRLSQPGRPGPHICIPQEQGDPVIPPGTGFPFRHLLQLAGLQWRYSNPPPRGEVRINLNTSKYEYINLVCTSQGTHYVSATKPYLLFFFTEIIAVCFIIRIT
jgi:hypothetical protein